MTKNLLKEIQIVKSLPTESIIIALHSLPYKPVQAFPKTIVVIISQLQNLL